MQALTAFIMTIGRNLIGMILTKTVIIWGLKLAAKQTDNKIDDNAINIIEGLYNNDVDQVKKSVELLTEAVKEESK